MGCTELEGFPMLEAKTIESLESTKIPWVFSTDLCWKTPFGGWGLRAFAIDSTFMDLFLKHIKSWFLAIARKKPTQVYCIFIVWSRCEQLQVSIEHRVFIVVGFHGRETPQGWDHKIHKTKCMWLGWHIFWGYFSIFSGDFFFSIFCDYQSHQTRTATWCPVNATWCTCRLHFCLAQKGEGIKIELGGCLWQYLIS